METKPLLDQSISVSGVIRLTPDICRARVHEVTALSAVQKRETNPKCFDVALKMPFQPTRLTDKPMRTSKQPRLSETNTEHKQMEKDTHGIAWVQNRGAWQPRGGGYTGG